LLYVLYSPYWKNAAIKNVQDKECKFLEKIFKMIKRTYVVKQWRTAIFCLEMTQEVQNGSTRCCRFYSHHFDWRYIVSRDTWTNETFWMKF
jgi:hypothetical protein